MRDVQKVEINEKEKSKKRRFYFEKIRKPFPRQRDKFLSTEKGNKGYTRKQNEETLKEEIDEYTRTTTITDTTN